MLLAISHWHQILHQLESGWRKKTEVPQESKDKEHTVQMPAPLHHSESIWIHDNAFLRSYNDLQDLRNLTIPTTSSELKLSIKLHKIFSNNSWRKEKSVRHVSCIHMPSKNFWKISSRMILAMVKSISLWSKLLRTRLSRCSRWLHISTMPSPSHIYLFFATGIEVTCSFINTSYNVNHICIQGNMSMIRKSRD